MKAEHKRGKEPDELVTARIEEDAVTAAIEAAGFDARIRPEALTLEDFAKIQNALAR